MPAGSESTIAGGYTVTWNGVAVGMLEGDGGLPTVDQSGQSETLANTSVYGKTPIDDLYLGNAPSASMTCLEYRAGSAAAWWPYNATLGRLGTIGVWMYSLSATLALTAIAGTSASATPATWTASKTVLMPGFATRLVYGPTLRKVPLRFRLYPYLNSSNVVFWIET